MSLDIPALATATLTAEPLYPFQRDGVRFLIEKGRAILADDMGLGKTRQAIYAIGDVRRRQNPGNPVIVVAPKIALGVWRDEILRWTASAVDFYAYEPHKGVRVETFTSATPINPPRNSIFDACDFLLVNPAMLERFLDALPRRRRFDHLIIDEAHIFANPRTTQTRNVRKLAKRCGGIFHLTGTPVRNMFTDLWPLLNMIDPLKYASYWEFVKRHALTVEEYNRVEVVGIKSTAALQAEISPYIIRRRKADVLTQLPPKTRQRIPLTLTPKQNALYQKLAEESLIELENEEIVTTTSVLAKMVRLRQITICPALVDPSLPPESAVLTALTELAVSNADTSYRAIIWTPFRQAIPFIERALAAGDPCVRTHVLHGELTPTERQSALDAFNAPLPSAVTDTRRIDRHPQTYLIATIGVGTSFTAIGSSDSWFVGYDYVPANNAQAEDRQHRIGQHYPVTARYFVNTDTIDEHIMAILDGKVRWETLALDPRVLVRPNGTASATANSGGDA